MNEVRPGSSNVAPLVAGKVSSQAQAANSGEGKVVTGKSVPNPEPQSQTVSQVAEETANFGAVQERLQQAVSKLNDYVQSTQRDLQFNFDDDAGRPIVTVIDRETREVIRQIPDDVVLNLAQKLNEEEPFRLFSAKV